MAVEGGSECLAEYLANASGSLLAVLSGQLHFAEEEPEAQGTEVMWLK